MSLFNKQPETLTPESELLPGAETTLFWGRESLWRVFGRTLVKATAVAIPFTAGAWLIADEVVRQPVEQELGQTRQEVNATLQQESQGLNETLLTQAAGLDQKIDGALTNIEDAKSDVNDIKTAVENLMLQLGFMVDDDGELIPITTLPPTTTVPN